MTFILQVVLNSSVMDIKKDVLLELSMLEVVMLISNL